MGKVGGFQTAFFDCLCCTVSTGILVITVLRGSYECMLEAGQLGAACERDTYGFSVILKMGLAFACYAMKGLEDTALFLWFQACRVKGLFDRRQLRGNAERGGANSCHVFEVRGVYFVSNGEHKDLPCPLDLWGAYG